jgi:MoxR-like ATPase
MSKTNQPDWWIYKGIGKPHDAIQREKDATNGTIKKGLPLPPNWRKFSDETIPVRRREAEITDADIRRHIGSNPAHSENYDATEDKELIKEIEMVNAALFLRRPLLVTGKPGSGKSSLAYAVAYELKLGRVLRWPITTRSTLADGLYRYDAIGRLQDASYKRYQSSDAPVLKDSATNIGKYLRLGPLGTALLPVEYPRILLIDEIDKSDIDLPNDLLNIFEEGYFEIPELKRLLEEEQEEGREEPVMVMPDDGEDNSDRVPISGGKVKCNAFPFIILTSNGERDFPPAFKRRCLQLEMQLPSEKRLSEIVQAHFGLDELEQNQTQALIKDFLERRSKGPGTLATDQLLNALYMTSNSVTLKDKENLLTALLRHI